MRFLTLKALAPWTFILFNVAFTLKASKVLSIVNFGNSKGSYGGTLISGIPFNKYGLTFSTAASTHFTNSGSFLLHCGM